MRTIACAAVFTLIASVPAVAQTGLTGTWRIDGDGRAPFPWEVVFRVEGGRVSGRVSNCIGDPILRDARLDGDTVSFKCGPSDNHTISFTGNVNGDELSLQWTIDIREGGYKPNIRNAILFGPDAPKRLLLKRVPDGALAELTDAVLGIEVADAVNLRDSNVKVEGRLFLPVTASRVRSLIVVIYWGLGEPLFNDLGMRRLAATTASGLLVARFSGIGPSVSERANRFSYPALLALLPKLREASGHEELISVPFFFWGHSTGGSGAVDFAVAAPERTIGIVLYHSAGGGSQRPKIPSEIPLLHFHPGEKVDGPNDEEAFWKRGREMGAPWTFVVEPYATHMNDEDISKAHDLLIPWITAVQRLRVSSESTALRRISGASGWLGEISTGEVSSYATFRASKLEASWLPDEASARGWRVVSSRQK